MSDVSTNTDPSTPIRPRPTRPALSTERLTIYTSASTPSFTPDSTPDNTTSPTDPLQTPTPTTPTRAHHKSGNRKSIGNVRRKPVPLTQDDLDLELSHIQHNPDGMSTPSDVPPVSYRPPNYPYQQSMHSSTGSHVLLVDPPTYVADNNDPFMTPRTEYQSRTSLPDMDQAVIGRSSEGESLPTYEVETKTEPATLARGLWRVGWAIPILWIIGMCILWIPLKPLEEETDPEKAQKLSEMIAILRETELRYAKRCMWGVVGWGVLIALIILVCVLVKQLS